MGNDRYAEFGAHQQDCHDLVHAGQSTGVELHSIQSLSLQQLLEHDPIVDMLSCSNADTMRLQRGSDPGMTQDVVW